MMCLYLFKDEPVKLQKLRVMLIKESLLQNIDTMPTPKFDAPVHTVRSIFFLLKLSKLDGKPYKK